MPNASLFQTDARIVRVALPVPVDELFDYTVPEAFAAHARPGFRAVVPFGARQLTGVIVACGASPAVSNRNATRLRPLVRILDREPALGPDMLDLLREMARELLCPVGIALASALPTGASPKSVPAFELTERGRQALAHNVARGPSRTLLKLLADGPVPIKTLERGVAQADDTMRTCLRDGLVAKTLFEKGATAKEATARTVELAPGVDPDLLAENELRRAPKQLAFLREIASAGCTPIADLRASFPTAPALVRALEARKLVRVGEKRVPRNVLGARVTCVPAPQLTDEQRAALEPIEGAIRAKTAQTFLLHGVTGSGKTEIYLRAVAAARELGRTALLLVPEIPLTHQILTRLRGRFGDNLAVLHSGLSVSERFEQWSRLRRCETAIAVGARSALFAPLENLGVIVIDEEHDSAYKSEEGFRYHARDLAQKRAEACGCPLILGSATPALETRYAAETGQIQRLVLSKRIASRPLPRVQVVDLAKESAHTASGQRPILSRALERAISDTLAAGDQSFLFLNRRGFSTKVLCYECGKAAHCKNCDIALVFHAHDQLLRCHYCDYSIEPPEHCPHCGAGGAALLGLGTQRLEEEVRTRFPEARIARLDRDVSRRKGATEAILTSVQEGSLDILIGTQMIAKGHDFPNVRTVGIVLADLGLHMPDFRAAEHTFQLLTQVAGRAGRAETHGNVLLQTFSPDHYAIRPVCEHDYEAFYAEELEYRRDLGYPPFTKLIHLLIEGRDATQTKETIEGLARTLREKLPHETSPLAAEAAFEILGPAPCPLARLRGLHRYQLLLKGSDAVALRSAACALRDASARLPSGLRARIDLNPIHML